VEDSALSEIQRLKVELKRVTEEKDILKEAAVYFAGEPKKSTRS
jgi:transposase